MSESKTKSDPDQWSANIAAAFTPFCDDEVEQLQLYRRHVAEFGGWDLANQEKIVARIGTKDGDHVEGATPVEVTALLTTYRKVSVAQKDPGTFEKVRNILARHAKDKETPEAEIGLEWLSALKRWRKETQQNSKALGYKVQRADGQVETLKPKEIMEWLIDGVIFHADETGRQNWESLGGWSSVPLLMNVLVMLNDEVAIFRAMSEVVGLILDEPDLRA